MESDETTFATKSDIKDLKGDIKDLEVKFHKELNTQTNKFLGILVALGTIFKLLEIFAHVIK